jgi:hypothetical protein
MKEKPVWLEAVERALESVYSSQESSGDEPVSIDTIRADYKRFCRRVEDELVRLGVDESDEEWHATQAIMKTIYKKTKQAYRRGYNTCECLYGPFLHGLHWPESSLSGNIREAVKMWSRVLGWRSVTVTPSRLAPSPLPIKRLNLSSEYRSAIRLEGLRTPESHIRWT